MAGMQCRRQEELVALDKATVGAVGEGYKGNVQDWTWRVQRRIRATRSSRSEPGAVLDNLRTHEARPVHNCLVRRPRFHLHFAPASARPGST